MEASNEVTLARAFDAKGDVMTITTSTGRRHARQATDRVQSLFDDQYRHHAEWEGDERPRKDAASARRMATGAISAVKQFESLLPREDAETLRRAGAILRTLAGDLDEVAAISRVAKTERERRNTKARLEAADQMAAGRWASENAMRAEAADLAAFVDRSRESGASAWVLAKHPGCTMAAFPDQMPPGRRLVDMLNLKNGPIDLLTLTRRSAEYVLGLGAGQRSNQRRSRDMWVVGLDDYEDWRSQGHGPRGLAA